MIVSEFIEWLKTQDQGATVEVLVREPSTGYGGDTVSVVDFDVEEHQEYTDMRDNPYAKGMDYENSRTLLLGNR